MKRGHVTGHKKEQHGTAQFSTPWYVRVAQWEAKQAAEQAVKVKPPA